MYAVNIRLNRFLLFWTEKEFNVLTRFSFIFLGVCKALLARDGSFSSAGVESRHLLIDESSLTMVVYKLFLMETKKTRTGMNNLVVTIT